MNKNTTLLLLLISVLLIGCSKSKSGGGLGPEPGPEPGGEDPLPTEHSTSLTAKALKGTWTQYVFNKTVRYKNGNKPGQLSMRYPEGDGHSYTYDGVSQFEERDGRGTLIIKGTYKVVPEENNAKETRIEHNFSFINQPDSLRKRFHKFSSISNLRFTLIDSVAMDTVAKDLVIIDRKTFRNEQQIPGKYPNVVKETIAKDYLLGKWEITENRKITNGVSENQSSMLKNKFVFKSDMTCEEYIYRGSSKPDSLLRTVDFSIFEDVIYMYRPDNKKVRSLFDRVGIQEIDDNNSMLRSITDSEYVTSLLWIKDWKNKGKGSAGNESFEIYSITAETQGKGDSKRVIQVEQKTRLKKL